MGALTLRRVLLLTNIAQAAPPGDQSGNLLGIAAIVAAIVPLILGLIAYYRRSGPSPDPGLVDDAHRRVELLRADIADLTKSLEQCRAERRVMTAEAKVKDMEIGSLQGRLADCRKALEEAGGEAI